MENRYCKELFSDVIEYSKLDSDKAVLEIGPGTGQATEPILKTGCSYLAIELGEHLAEYIWISTHAPQITLQEPYKSKFFTGIKDAILSFGNNITIYDTIILCLARIATVVTPVAVLALLMIYMVKKERRVRTIVVLSALVTLGALGIAFSKTALYGLLMG